jgi:hypothetical protein
MQLFVLLVCFLTLSVATKEAEIVIPSKRVSDVFVSVGDNIGRHVAGRIRHLLEKVAGIHLIEFDDWVTGTDLPIGAASTILFLGFGNCTQCDVAIPRVKLQELPDESYIIASKERRTNQFEIICNGNSLHHGPPHVNYGAVSCAYHVLELLGYAFIHPLDPVIPKYISLSTENLVNIIESPRWPIRIFHYHTQHPLELNEVLQGLDIPMFGPLGPECLKSKDDPVHKKTNGLYCERWEDMVKEVDLMFEWCIANKFNRAEWLLLGNYKWKEFDSSDTRMKRMRILTDLGHQYGLMVGADVPIGNVQQHAWYMVNTRLPYSRQVMVPLL